MIRVANVHTDGRFGGPQSRIVQVASQLSSRGIDTVVIGPHRDADRFRQACADAGVPYRGVRLHRLTRERRELLAYVLSFLPELMGLVAALRRERVDIVHCNGAWQVKPVLAGWLLRRKVVLHLNDTSPTRLLHGLFGVLGRLCAGFVYAGEQVRKIYRTEERFPAAVGAVIQAPVDLDRFDPERTAPEPALAAAPGPRVVTVANVNADKGLEFFVEAAGRVCARHPDASFHVVGSFLDSQRAYGERLRARARELAGERIVFRGPSSDVPAVLAAADIYVCSSVREASPMSVWEAMAMARPIVATRVGDVPALLEDGVHGLVAPVGSAEELAAGIERLLDAPDLAARLGRAARQRAAERLALPVCAAAHERLYRSLVG